MITHPTKRGFFATGLAWCTNASAPRGATDTPCSGVETDRDRRDFFLGLMEDHPDAFSSESDVQCMMHLYPGRF